MAGGRHRQERSLFKTDLPERLNFRDFSNPVIGGSWTILIDCRG
jgi:hypothetical protein